MYKRQSYCIAISACSAVSVSAATNAYGFSHCAILSACRAVTVTSSAVGNAYGFDTCTEISACVAGSISGVVAEGFHACVHGSALHTAKAVNAGNTHMDSVDAQTTPYSIELNFT